MRHTLEPGARVGGFRVIELLGRGGMGAVYRALDETRGREVALKLLQADFIDERMLARFARETNAGASLDHENIAAVYSAGRHEGTPFLSMELLPGGSLERLVARGGPLDPRRAAALGAGVARGLAALHEAGFVHRDLKPANVLLDGRGRPRIADLGLVGVLDASRSLTRTGELIGTPQYLAPEQLGEKG
ncbi:MAG: serine/threonine-protein kinase, partial [Planctomycetota bacterium]